MVGNPNIKDWGFGGKYSSPEHDRAAWIKQKGVPKWTKERCVSRINDILDRMDKLLLESEKINKDNPKGLKQESVRDMNTMMNRLLDFMKYLYPPIQQNLNMNVDIKFEDYIDKVKARLEEKYGIVITNIEEPEQGAGVEITNNISQNKFNEVEQEEEEEH